MPDQSHKITFTGAMNSDLEPRLIPEGDYLPGTKNFDNADAITGKVGAMVNPVSNRLIPYTQPAGENEVMGNYFHDETRKLYRFVWNSNNYHHIIETDEATEDTVYLVHNLVQTGGVNVLNFDREHPIVHINIKRGLLFWVEGGYNDARKLNIERARNSEYGLITEDIISAAKAQPLAPPTIVYTTDASKSYNRLKRKLFYARTQFVYDDYEESAWSSISKRPFIPGEGDPNKDSNAILNNVLVITINTGPSNVRKINIAVSDNDEMKFYKVATIDKADLGLADNISCAYNFYNDVNGIAIPDEDSLLNYDNFPEKPVCQDLVNDDIIDYANFEEGKDNLTELNAQFTFIFNNPTANNGIINVYKTFKHNSSYLPGIIYEDKIGRQWLVQSKQGWLRETPKINQNYGTYGILEYQINHKPPLEAVKWQPCLTRNLTHVASLEWVTDHIVPGYDTNVTNRNGNDYLMLELNSFYEYKAYKKYEAIGYDFEAGDRINFIGLVDSATASPSFSPSSYYDTEILDIIEDERRDYDAIASCSGNEFTVNIDGFFDSTFRGLQVYITGTIHIMGSVSNNGRTIFITPPKSVENTTDWHVILPGKWLKIAKPTFTVSKNLFIEIYKPKQLNSDTNSDNVFYEIGECYDVLNPGLSNRAHQGPIQDQDENQPAIGRIYGADCYIKTRNIKFKRIDRISDVGLINLIVEDFNFSDYYPSKLYDYGRFSAQNPNAKRLKRIATHRFSRPYVAETNINGLSRFYPGNQKTYEEQYGEILRIKYNDRVLANLQELRVGKILVNQRMLTSPDGSATVAVSDQLLNDIQYAPQKFGIGRSPESYALYGGIEYFADTYRGVICAMSGLEIKAVSEEAFYAQFWTKTLADIRNTSAKMPGYIDPERKRYILSIKP